MLVKVYQINHPSQLRPFIVERKRQKRNLRAGPEHATNINLVDACAHAHHVI